MFRLRTVGNARAVFLGLPRVNVIVWRVAVVNTTATTITATTTTTVGMAAAETVKTIVQPI